MWWLPLAIGAGTTIAGALAGGKDKAAGARRAPAQAPIMFGDNRWQAGQQPYALQSSPMPAFQPVPIPGPPPQPMPQGASGPLLGPSPVPPPAPALNPEDDPIYFGGQ